MKTLYLMLILCLAAFATPSFAQQPTAAAAGAECDGFGPCPNDQAGQVDPIAEILGIQEESLKKVDQLLVNMDEILKALREMRDLFRSIQPTTPTSTPKPASPQNSTSKADSSEPRTLEALVKKLQSAASNAEVSATLADILSLPLDPPLSLTRRRDMVSLALIRESRLNGTQPGPVDNLLGRYPGITGNLTKFISELRKLK